MVNDKGPSRDEWLIYRGNGKPHDEIRALPDPPPWRQFDPAHGRLNRAYTFQIGPSEVDIINMAIHLRRPLLVTGEPGTGKSSLADNIAYELGLEPVLKWFVTSRSSLADALYTYDALGYFQAVSASPVRDDSSVDAGQYVRLGPLGTSLLPRDKPRVLLIDELDRSDIDLPIQLLTLFEEGQFYIPELERHSQKHSSFEVLTADHGERAKVYGGRVACAAFPLIVITSNGEREFPPSFIRRCVSLDLKSPEKEKLAAIVKAHLGDAVLESSRPLLEKYCDALSRGDITTDQFLNVAYLTAHGRQPPEEQLSALLLRQSGADG